MISPRLFVTLMVTTIVCLAAPAIAEDHSDFFDGPFETGPDVTEACLMCHEDAAQEVMATSHWTWTSLQEWEGSKGAHQRGKANIFNNFCIAVSSNWPRCTSCHAGYGWKDASFDFHDSTHVDCLVCHDGTGTYRKSPTGAGNPAADVDLLAVARSVGNPPTLQNCGACHFYGGGGDHVKHGDLDSSLIGASREYDVHMSSDGAGFSCQDCHVTRKHVIQGNAFAVSPGHTNPIGCTECHGEEPHENRYLNDHQRVACQTCHIPYFAKKMPTMVRWDWSVAGQDLPPQPDEYGLPTYSKKKGRFVWEKNVEPSYAWYDGTARVYSLGDLIDPAGTVDLTEPVGSKDEPGARIYPFKVHEGRQIYDTKRMVLIVPKLYGEGGYWQTFDWDQAARLGMASVGEDYSGSYGFVDTRMYWRLNHMVVPGDLALKCRDCHAAGDRLDWEALGYGDDPIRLRRAKRSAERD